MAFLKSNNLTLAIEEIEKSLKQYPNQADALILKAKLYWAINRKEEGNSLMWKAHELEPKHAQIIEFLEIMKPKAEESYQNAVKHMLEGDETTALLFIEKGLQFYHNFCKLHLIKACILRNQKQYESAIDCLEDATKNMEAENQENEVKIQISITYNELAKMLFSKSKYDAALSVFHEALKYLPQDSGILINIGGIY